METLMDKIRQIKEEMFDKEVKDSDSVIFHGLFTSERFSFTAEGIYQSVFSDDTIRASNTKLEILFDTSQIIDIYKREQTLFVEVNPFVLKEYK